MADLRRLIRVLAGAPAGRPVGAPIAALAARLPPTAAAAAARQSLAAARLDAAVRVPAEADGLGLTVRETLSRLILGCAARMARWSPAGGYCHIEITIDPVAAEFEAHHLVGPNGGPTDLGPLHARLVLLGGTLTATCLDGRWRAVGWLPRDT